MFYMCFMVYHNVLQVFHDVLLCLAMLMSRAVIGIGDCTASNSLRDQQYNRESDPMLNSILNGDWSNSVPGTKFPKGSQVYTKVMSTVLIKYVNDTFQFQSLWSVYCCTN